MNGFTHSEISPTHRTWAQIDTDALKKNFDAIRKNTSEKTKVCAVIKADAYGHGALIAARALEKRADFFMVAEISEALRLRDSGVTEPILIAGLTDPSYAPLMADLGIRQCVYSLSYAEALNKKADGKKLKIHLKLDTGMSRLGFTTEREDFALTAGKVFGMKNLIPEGVFSHYAESDDLTSDFTDLQTERFDSALGKLEKEGFEFEIKHISNSAASMRSDNSSRGMVRAGICLYGAYPSEQIKKLWEEKNAPLIPVMALKTRIAQIRELKPGESAGYDRRFTASKPTKIAVLCAGYADGLPRLLASPPGARVIDE
ncbi:MAG: alanine racemase, partial [Clostridia bacterium]|nr:alanine racemase [Clostridia bacterium]